MKTRFLQIVLIFAIVMLSASVVRATTYTWTGTTSTAWATTTNWSPSTGYPGSAATLDIAQIGVVSFTGSQPTMSVVPPNPLGAITLGTATNATLTISAVISPTITGLVTIGAGSSWIETAAATPIFRGGIANSGTFTASTGVHTFNTNAQALTGTLSIPRVTVTTITLTNNGILTVGTALAGTGGLTNSATGTLNIGGPTTTGISITTLTATDAGNTVNYTGAAQTVKATAYDNLTLSGTGAKTTTGITVNAIFEFGGNAAVTVSAVPTYGASATLKYNKTAVFTAATEWPTSFAGTGGVIIAGTSTGAITRNAGGPYTVSKLTISTNAVLNYQRAITVSGTTDIYGTVNWTSSSTTTRAETFTGNVTIYSGAVWTEPATGNGANNTYDFAGNFTNNANTFTGSGTGLHTFSGTSTTISGSAITNFPSVTFTGAYTNSGKLTAATILTVTGVTLTNDGTITATTALSGTGGITQGGTGILNIGAASAITTLTATAAGNTVNYTGAAQTIKTPTGATPTYYNLGLSGSLAKTFGADMAITGNLSISGTAVASLVTFNCTSATLQLGGVYQVGGTWGSTAATGATNKNLTYFGATGTGVLTVSGGCIAGQWTGATSADWATTSNWCSGTLPIASTDVTIPSGTLFQPTISAIGAVCKNMTINSGATLTMSGTGALTVSGNWSNSGTLTAGTGTVTFNNTPVAAQTITGTSVFNNLTINNTLGVTLASEGVAVNGILDLQSTNASASQGTLHTGIYTLLITNEAASTTGTGDVSGTIKRTHTFNPNTSYSFGSQYTTLDFINTGTQPNELTCKIVLGSPLPGTDNTGSVLRYYSFAQTGTTGTDQVIVNLRYLVAELQSNTESNLVFYDYHTANSSSHEHGKTNYDATNHWTGLSGRLIGYIALPTLAEKQWGLRNSSAVKNTWDGSVSTDWTTGGNWSTNVAPLTTENVLIPVVATVYPVLTSNVEIKTLEIATGATLTAGSGTYYNITINGNLAAWINHGTFVPGTGRVVFSHNVSGELVAMDGTTDFYDIETLYANTYLQPASDNTMKIAGNIYQTAGIIDLVTTSNTVDYTGTTSRTIINPVGPASDRGYHGLKISTTGGGTITFPSTLNIAGDFTNNGTVSAGSGTVIMKDNEHLQNIGGITSTAFYNLTIDNTNQSVFVNSPITVSNALAVNSLTTMDMVTNALNGVTSTSGTGTFKTQNTSSTPIPSGKTWSFDADYNGAGQTVMAGTYANLTLSGSGTKTAAGALSVTGALAVASGITLDMVTYALSGVATNSGTGTLKTQNTSPTPIPFGKTWGFGLVEYNGAGQTVIDGTYTDLTLSGSGTKTLPSASTTIGGNFLQSGSAAASGAAGAMSLSGNFTNSSSGSFAPSAGTFTFGGTTAQTIDATGAIAFSGLTINNAAGVTGSCDISVSGELYLQSANASDVKGSLDMVDPFKLSLGIDATTTGTGDVTGIVRRAHTFVAGTSYTFNHQFSTIILSAGGTFPTALENKLKIGTAPSWKPLAVKRIDDWIREGAGTGSYLIIASHYLDSELQGNDENKIVRWKYVSTSSPTVTEVGRSAYSTSDNWVANANIAVATKIHTAYGWERSYANSEVATLTWNGSLNTDFSNQNNWTPAGTPGSTKNIVIPDGSQTSNTPVLTAATEINSLSIENAGVLNSGNFLLTVYGTTGAWNNQGIFNSGTGTVVFTGKSADLSGSTDFYNLTINENARLATLSGAVIGIGGAVTINGTAGTRGIWSTFSSGITTVNYKGGDQTVVIPDASTNRYYNLMLSGSGIKTMPASAMTLHGTFTMSGTASATAQGALSIIGSHPNVIIGDGTSFAAGSFTHNIAGNFENNGTFVSAGSTFNFNGTSLQTIGGTTEPTTFGDVTVSNTNGVVLQNNVTASALNITTGALTVTAGKYITANGTTTLNSAECLVLKSDATGTASFIDNGTITITNSGSAKVERYLTPYAGPTDSQYHFFSSPVAGQQIRSEFVSLPNTTNDFYAWGETTNEWINTKNLLDGSWNSGFENTFTQGKGYLVSYPSTVTKNFIGTPYTSTDGLTMNCSYTTGKGNGWNLLGNPFPSPIDWESITKTNMDDALYYYDNTAANYRYYVGSSGGLNGGSQYIPAMQGFMVHATSASGTPNIKMKNSDRVQYGLNTYYKSESMTSNILDLNVEGNGYNDYTRVCFYGSATSEFDGRYDAYKMWSYNTKVPQIYTITPANTSLAINTLPESVLEGGTVPLNFKASTTGTYTLTAEKINTFSATYITLEDKATNTLQKLNDKPVYTFTATPQDAINRFVLHFKDATSIPEPTTDKGIVVSFINGIVKVETDLIGVSGDIKVSDMNGRTVAVSKYISGTATTFHLNVKPGVYMVSLYTANQIYSQKVLVY